MFVLHIIREIKIKATMRYNFHLSDWQRSKSLITCCAGDDASRQHSHTLTQLLWGMADPLKQRISQQKLVLPP